MNIVQGKVLSSFYDHIILQTKHTTCQGCERFDCVAADRHPSTHVSYNHVITFQLRDISVFTLVQMNRPEWAWLFCGLLACIVNGLVTPAYAYFYGEVFAVSNYMLTRVSF